VKGRYQKGGRFWEIHLLGPELRTRSGAAGAPGFERVIRLSDGNVAADRHHKLTLARVRAGWWLDEPADRPEERPVAGPAPASHPELVAAALAALDEAPLLVWADWLTAAGDPRGELIAIDVARERSPDDELDRRRAALLRSSGSRLLGTLDLKGLTWSRGLVTGAVLEDPFGDELVDELFAAPAVCGLRKLTLTNASSEAIAAIGREPRPHLVELAAYGAAKVIGFGPLWAACPSLRSVVAGARSVELQKVPKTLESLEVRGACAEREVTAALTGGQLATLVLHQPPGALLERLAADPRLGASLQTLKVPKSPAASKVRAARRGATKVEWLAGS
jgi:uncharacterized protein (TIGR02996 family)